LGKKKKILNKNFREIESRFLKEDNRMIILGKSLSKKTFLKGGLISLILVFMLFSCASSPKEFDPNITDPQMVVDPDTIRLGVAKLTKTQIVFRGKGFQPEDSVFIELLDVKKKGQVANIPIADGNVDQKGYFTAKVGTLVKVSELLRAKIGSNEKMENIIIVTQPPMPEGVYRARAVSMESDKKAECNLTVKGPSILDRIKDWIGCILGKIVKK